ncbi:MAG TPA: hypothetical protein VGG41_00420 [Solirubrobacteraceae bacterium]|jgi:hypothetical protein
MHDSTASQPVSIDPTGLLASEILRNLYQAVAGQEPAAVRSYRDEDAILLLLRFDPAELTEREGDDRIPFLDTAFMAMPGMIASAVEARTGHRLAPGNLSVSPDRGLAVFAFSALEEPAETESDEDHDEIFRIDTRALVASPSGVSSLRHAS